MCLSNSVESESQVPEEDRKMPAVDLEDSDSDHVAVEKLDETGFDEEDWQHTDPTEEDLEDIKNPLDDPFE